MLMQVFDQLTSDLPRHLHFLLNTPDLVKYLEEKHAVWHKSCRICYNQSKAEKHKSRLAKLNATSSNVNNSNESNANEYKERRSDRLPQKNDNETSKCFFCDEIDCSKNMHLVSTFNINEKIRNAADRLDDHDLLAKLSAGDLIALEAKYHLSCLTKLYNRAKGKPTVQSDDRPVWSESVAFAELCDYVKATLS